MGCGSSMDEAHLARMRMNGGLSGGGSSMLGGSQHSGVGAAGTDGGGSYLPSQIPTIIVTPPSVLPPSGPVGPNPNAPQQQQQQQPQSKGGTADAAAAGAGVGGAATASKSEQTQTTAQNSGGAATQSAAAASSSSAAASSTAAAAAAPSAAGHTPNAASDTYIFGTLNHHHAHAHSISGADRGDGASSPEQQQQQRDRARSSSGSNHSASGAGSGVHTPPVAATAAAAASSAASSAPLTRAVHSGHSSRSPSAGSMHSSLTIQTAVISANRANHSGEGGGPRYVISDRGGSRGPQSRSSGFSHPAQPESPSIKPRQMRGDRGGGGDDLMMHHRAPISPQGNHRSTGDGTGACGGGGVDGSERIFEFANNNEHVIIPGIDMTADDPLADESDEMRVHGRAGSSGGLDLVGFGSGGGGAGGTGDSSNAGASERDTAGQIRPLSSSPPTQTLQPSDSHSTLHLQLHSPPPKQRDDDARGSIYSPPSAADRSREVSAVSSSVGDEGSVLAMAAAAATKQTRMAR